MTTSQNSPESIDFNANDLFNKIALYFSIDHFNPQAFPSEPNFLLPSIKVARDLAFYPDHFLENYINPQWPKSSPNNKISICKEEYLTVKQSMELGVILLYVPLFLLTLFLGTLLGYTSLPTPDTLWWPSHEWLLTYKLYFLNLLLVPIVLTPLFDLDAQYYTSGFMACFMIIMERGVQNFLFAAFVTLGIYYLFSYFPQRTLALPIIQSLRYIIPSCLLFYFFVLEAIGVVTAILLTLTVLYFKDIVRAGKLFKNGKPYTIYFKYWIIILLGSGLAIHVVPYMQFILTLPIIGIYLVFFLLVQLDGT